MATFGVECYLIIDCGTSSCRVCLVSTEGAMLLESKGGVRLHAPRPGYAEVDTEELWSTVRSLIREGLRRTPNANVAAVGVSSMTGWVFLGCDGRPLIPAITWIDNRSQAESREIAGIIGEEELFARTGRKAAPEHLASRIRWVMRNLPDVYGKTRGVIGLKDEIVRRLTGAILTDFSFFNYSLLGNIHRTTWDADIVASLRIRESILPEVKPATAIAGLISKAAAIETGLPQGLPVATGSSDGTAAIYGVGVLEAGNAVLVSGTSDTLMVCSPRIPQDCSRTLIVNTGMVTNTFIVGGTMALTGGALQWATDCLSVRLPDLDAALRAIPPGSGGLLFLPGLRGERSPYWKDHYRGAVIGLTLAHRPEHIVRSVMEGVALRMRRLIAIIREAGIDMRQVTIAGGCSQLDLWNQIRADANEIDFVRTSVVEATSMGTAAYCRAMLDPALTLRSIAAGWRCESERYRPDPARAPVYRKHAELFEKCMRDLDDVFGRLGAAPGEPPA
jgi:xylulokinase